MPTATPLRHRAGFSLVEILIVISIIALLVALVTPVIGMVRSSARTVGCMNNLSQIGVAVRGWATDHNGVIVPAWDDALGSGTIQSKWQGQLRPYMFNDAVAVGSRIEQSFRCPEMRGEMVWDHTDPTTYGKNIRTGQCPPPQNNNGYPLLKFAQLTSATEAMIIADSAAYSDGHHPRDFHKWISGAGIWGVAFSHRGKGSFLMGDGHVEMRAKSFGETWDENGGAAFTTTTFWNVASAPY